MKSVCTDSSVLCAVRVSVVIATFALAACKGNADPGVAAGNGRPQMLSAMEPSPNDVQMAGAALAQGNTPLAMDHVSRQLDRSPGDAEALALLAKCVRTLTVEACKREDHMEALALVKQLALRVEAAHAARSQSYEPLNDLQARNHDIADINASITASADEQSRGHLNAAMCHAYAAYHWLGTNDRNQVRAGLQELRWVHDRGPALSKGFIGWYYQDLNQLKGLVSNSEWEPLLAEAGFVEKVVGQ